MENKYYSGVNQIRIPRKILTTGLLNSNTEVLGLYLLICRKINSEGEVAPISFTQLSELSQVIYTKENAGRFRNHFKKSLDILKTAGYIIDYSFNKNVLNISSSFDLIVPNGNNAEDIRILSRFDYEKLVNELYTFNDNTTNIYGRHKVSVWDALFIFTFVKFSMIQWHKNNNRKDWDGHPLVAKITYEDVYANVPFSDMKIKLTFKLLQRLDLIEVSKPIKYKNAQGLLQCGRTLIVEKTPLSNKKYSWQREFNNGIRDYERFFLSIQSHMINFDKYLLDEPDILQEDD